MKSFFNEGQQCFTNKSNNINMNFKVFFLFFCLKILNKEYNYESHVLSYIFLYRYLLKMPTFHIPQLYSINFINTLLFDIWCKLFIEGTRVRTRHTLPRLSYYKHTIRYNCKKINICWFFSAYLT